MPSGLENLDGGRFILRYEHPWGGVASNAAPQDIAPNQLVSSDGTFIRNGRICSTNFYAFDPNYFRWSLNSTNLYIPNISGMVAVYAINNVLAAIDYTCQTYLYATGQGHWVVDFPPPTGGARYACSVLIENIVYIFDYMNGAEYVYSPGNYNRFAVQVDGSNQNFVGGKYCMTVDRYLITCNTNMPSDTPQYKANGYSWSGPSKYQTFDPSKDSTVNEGNNILAEVQHEITGCFAMGNVGYILHDQGITQLTPTGSSTAGIIPFDATLLWGGKNGNGCTYPGSLAIYGYVAIWANNNDVLMFMAGAAPQSITGTARRVIFNDLNKFKPGTNVFFNVFGNLINVGVDNLSPELVYNLYIIYSDPSNQYAVNMVVWSFVFASQAWTRTYVNVSTTMQNITGNPSYRGMLAPTLAGDGSPNNSRAENMFFPKGFATISNLFESCVYGGMLFNVWNPDAGSGDSFFIFQYINTTGVSTIAAYPPVTNLVFRAEEFQIYRKPTIRGVILRASGGGTGPNNTGTLHININGHPFSDVIVNSPNVATIYRSFGVYTDMTPQLSITSTNFNGYITKVHVFGTYAEGEPI